MGIPVGSLCADFTPPGSSDKPFTCDCVASRVVTHIRGEIAVVCLCLGGIVLVVSNSKGIDEGLARVESEAPM